MPHSHFCDYAGHRWECDNPKCPCICGLLMEGNDHSDCPVELRACPDHEDEAARSIAGAMSSEPALIDEWRDRPECQCGCAESEMGKISGFCLWCTHTYTNYSPEVEDVHFSLHCTGAPKQLRESARERMGMGNQSKEKHPASST